MIWLLMPLVYDSHMFRKEVGDVRHGYVESALTSEFKIFGDREKTLEALLSTLSTGRGNQSISSEEKVVIPEFLPISTIGGIGVVAAKYLR